jgi:hypothetical protein
MASSHEGDCNIASRPGNIGPALRTHHSLPGPVYSGAGSLLGIGWLLPAASGSALRYLGEVWTVSHGFIFLALFAPVADGGRRRDLEVGAGQERA